MSSLKSRLKVYTLQDEGSWDEIVRSFPDHDIYWLSGYVKAFQLHGDGEPLLFHYEDGNTRGINVIMKRDVADDIHFRSKIEKERYFDAATPYGYGGWLVEGENTDELFNAYSREMKRQSIISEFVRFHPVVRNYCKCLNYYEVIKLGEVVHMDLASPDIIWNNFSSKNRNMIRKSMKNGVKIYNGRYPEIYKQFREIYNQTMDKDKAEDYYYFTGDFYDSILEDLPLNAQVFWAEKENTMIAAAIMLSANGKMNYHLSGSLREYNALAPTSLLLYKAALWGCANSYKTLYLGGGVGSGEDSLFQFKRAFYKGELNHFYIGKKIHDQDRYNELLALHGPIEKNYFPEYRA